MEPVTMSTFSNDTSYNKDFQGDVIPFFRQGKTNIEIGKGKLAPTHSSASTEVLSRVGKERKNYSF